MCPMSLLLVEWCENAELNSIISGGRQELELVAGFGKQGQSMQHALRIVG